MNNENRLATIRRLNHVLGLPPQAHDSTIFNGAFFDRATLEDIRLPPYNFEHPLSDYPPAEIITHIQEHGVLAGRMNSPKTYSVGVLDIQDPNNQFTTILTREVNRDGYWCLVQRSIFLHRQEPVATVDFIAPSTTLAIRGTPVPPDTDFLRPANQLG